MKKILCLLLAIVMLVSLCACGSDSNDNTGKGKDNETQSQTQKEPESEPEKIPEFSFGKISGNTYTNDFFGISCTLPNDIKFYNDEELATSNGIAADYTDEQKLEHFKTSKVYMDMCAANQLTGSNVNVTFDYFGEDSANINVKETLESQYSIIESSYQQMGYTNVSLTSTKVTVDGKEFDGVKLTAEIQGIKFYSTLFAFKKGEYMANITVCSLQTDITGDILDCFTIK